MAEYASGSETPTPSLTYFLSHSSGDDAIVRQMRIAPAELDTSLTIESRAFHGGDPLESTIRDAIASSSGVLVLVSPRAHQASWVGKELKHALAVQRKLLGESHLYTAYSYKTLANVLYAKGRNSEAETHHRAALEIRRKLLPADHSQIGDSLNDLALVFAQHTRQCKTRHRFF